MIHYDDVDAMIEKFMAASASLSPLELEGRIRAENGEVRWVRSLSRPRAREDGALIWDGVITDVTEQHEREADRERAATMLELGMEIAGIGTWEYEADSDTITASAFVNEIFGTGELTKPSPENVTWRPFIQRMSAKCASVSPGKPCGGKVAQGVIAS